MTSATIDSNSATKLKVKGPAIFALQARNQRAGKKELEVSTPLARIILREPLALVSIFLAAKRREEEAPWATITAKAAVAPQWDFKRRGAITKLI